MSETKLTGRERCDQADQANLKVGALLDLASMHATGGLEKPLDDAAEEFLDFLLDRAHKVHPSLQPLREIAHEAETKGWLEELSYRLYHANRMGLVVQFVTPVMTRMSKTSWSFSWGYTQSTYVYAESYEEAWRLGVAWAEQCRDEAKQERKKRPPKRAAAALSSNIKEEKNG